jgi:excisionase family DNA binding protein
VSVRKANISEKPVLLIAEAAEVLGVSEPTLRRWDASGRFPARRHPINGYRLFDREAVLRLRDEILADARKAS